MANQKRPVAFAPIQKEIGLRIRWARELVVPNRAEFARAMGVDRTTISKIEDGSRTPSIFDVMEIAHRLRLTTDYILNGALWGVDSELARMLAERHPELAASNYRATVGGRYLPPRTPRRAAD
jgi:transcriptional regulator with XRE-family HTH domain